ncbi:hypothetical protein [Rhizobium sp. 768_B6_N1_8]|jgi:hypothetical protein
MTEAGSLGGGDSGLDVVGEAMVSGDPGEEALDEPAETRVRGLILCR